MVMKSSYKNIEWLIEDGEDLIYVKRINKKNWHVKTTQLVLTYEIQKRGFYLFGKFIVRRKVLVLTEIKYVDFYKQRPNVNLPPPPPRIKKFKHN